MRCAVRWFELPIVSVRFSRDRFEVFECIRKICLVGFPVFFVNSPLEQILIGMIVCFISQSVFMCSHRIEARDEAEAKSRHKLWSMVAP